MVPLAPSNCPAPNASCPHEGRIYSLEQQDALIREALSKFEVKLDQILGYINKIAVLENKHSHHADEITRAFRRIEKLEQEVEALSRETRAFINKVDGVVSLSRWLWIGMGGTILAMLFKLMVFSETLPK